MLTIKDLIKAGFQMQLRTEQVVEYADIEDIEQLSIQDLMNGNYEYNVVDFEYGDSLKDIWLEKDGVGGVIGFEYFELILLNSDNIKEFQEKLIEVNPLFARISSSNEEKYV